MKDDLREEDLQENNDVEREVQENEVQENELKEYEEEREAGESIVEDVVEQGVQDENEQIEYNTSEEVSFEASETIDQTENNNNFEKEDTKVFTALMEPDRKNKKRGLLLMTCVGALAVLAICISIFLLKDKSKNTKDTNVTMKETAAESADTKGGEVKESPGEDAVNEVTTEAGANAGEVANDNSANTEEVVYPKCEVTLGEYKGLSVTLLPVEVTEEQVTTELNNLLTANPELKDITDRKDAKSGDVATIDYVGKVDGVEFQGGSATEFPLELGAGSFIPGFEDQIVGHTIGEQFDITVTFPADYTEPTLAGKEAVFTITLHKLGNYVDAVATDEFIAKNTEYATVKEFKEGTYNSLLEQAQANSEQQKEADLLNAAIENSTFSNLSEEEIQASVEEMTAYYENYAAQMGADLATFVTYYFGMDINKFNEEVKKAAEASLKQKYLLEKIIEEEAFELSEEEYVKRATDYAGEYGFTTYQEFESQYGKDIIKEAILSDLAVDLIVDSAVIQK